VSKQQQNKSAKVSDEEVRENIRKFDKHGKINQEKLDILTAERLMKYGTTKTLSQQATDIRIIKEKEQHQVYD